MMTYPVLWPTNEAEVGVEVDDTLSQARQVGMMNVRQHQNHIS